MLRVMIDATMRHLRNASTVVLPTIGKIENKVSLHPRA